MLRLRAPGITTAHGAVSPLTAEVEEILGEASSLEGWRGSTGTLCTLSSENTEEALEEEGRQLVQESPRQDEPADASERRESILNATREIEAATSQLQLDQSRQESIPPMTEIQGEPQNAKRRRVNPYSDPSFSQHPNDTSSRDQFWGMMEVASCGLLAF